MNKFQCFNMKVFSWLAIVILIASFDLKGAGVRDHALIIKNLILDGKDEAAQQLMQTAQSDEQIDGFNKAFLPFSYLYLFEDLNESKRSFDSLRSAYYWVDGFEGYEEIYNSFVEGYYEIKKNNTMTPSDLFRSKFGGDLDIVDLPLLISLGFALRMDASEVNPGNGNVEQLRAKGAEAENHGDSIVLESNLDSANFRDEYSLAVNQRDSVDHSVDVTSHPRMRTYYIGLIILMLVILVSVILIYGRKHR